VDERPKVTSSVSRDGKWLLFDRAALDTGTDIWVMALDGSAPPAPFVASPFQDRWAQFSPDGRWVAYMGDESGRREIYVRAFPGGEGTLRISPNGGDYPRWSPALLQNAGR